MNWRILKQFSHVEHIWKHLSAIFVSMPSSHQPAGHQTPGFSMIEMSSRKVSLNYSLLLLEITNHMCISIYLILSYLFSPLILSPCSYLFISESVRYLSGIYLIYYHSVRILLHYLIYCYSVTLRATAILICSWFLFTVLSVFKIFVS